MKAPNGLAIDATDELIPGTAGIVWEDDGTWEYDGNGTQVDWDGQTNVMIAGELVFLDEDGNRWLKSQLIPDDAEPLLMAEMKPWHADENLVEIEVRNTLTELLKRIGATKLDEKDFSTIIDDVISMSQEPA
jgi:hypothetical protein